jgi:hypothetical protein
VKFINMSNQRVKLSWEPQPGGTPNPMNNIAPFEASGTASFPSHSFIMTDPNDVSKIFKRFTVGEYPENIYYYDPYEVEGDAAATEKNLKKALSKKERSLYNKWRDTLKFNEVYKNFTGRSYLANYLRDPPRHFMWRADHFGQQHWVVSKETHFTKMPPDDMVQPIKASGIQRVLKEDEPRLLHEYRDPNQSTLNLTLTAVSVAPRVFEIPDFLSQTEVDHILKIAANTELRRSSVGDVGAGKSRSESGQSETRTSRNSWLERAKSPIIDAIYRRAADVMRIDEAMFRQRSKNEHPDWPSTGSLAEHLQVSHRRGYTRSVLWCWYDTKS